MCFYLSSPSDRKGEVDEQEERRIYLIDALLKEHSEYQTIDIPEDKDSQNFY